MACECAVACLGLSLLPLFFESFLPLSSDFRRLHHHRRHRRVAMQLRHTPHCTNAHSAGTSIATSRADGVGEIGAGEANRIESIDGAPLRKTQLAACRG